MHHVSDTPAKGTVTRQPSASLFPTGYMVSFALTTAIFFIWGMSNNLTDILVQQFKKSFELTLLEAQLVQTSVFLAYGIMATPAAFLMRRFGYKAGLVIGLVTFGIGTLMFWPAAIIGQYMPFLIALFIVGCGSSILETAANPLVAQFGDPSTSEQRLNFSQSFNPPGTIIGVLIGTFFIFSGVNKTPAEVTIMKAQGTYATYLHSEILRVVPTYVVLGLAVLVIAFFISRANFPKNLDSSAYAGYPSQVTPAKHGAYGRLFRKPQLMFAVVAQFFYVGAQVGTWSTLIPYLREYTSLGDRASGFFLTGTLIAFGLGRIVSTPFMRFLKPAKMISVYAVVNVLLLAVGIVHPGMAGSIAILATSFFMSIMYPTIFALGVKGLGDDTKIAGSLLVMTLVGGAMFPPLMGVWTRMTGSLAGGYVLPAAGFVVVAIYGYLSAYVLKTSVGQHTVENTPHGF
jgi:FHS family L-fucose permease-like MFS transporter